MACVYACSYDEALADCGLGLARGLRDRAVAEFDIVQPPRHVMPSLCGPDDDQPGRLHCTACAPPVNSRRASAAPSFVRTRRGCCASARALPPRGDEGTIARAHTTSHAPNVDSLI